MRSLRASRKPLTAIAVAAAAALALPTVAAADEAPPAPEAPAAEVLDLPLDQDALLGLIDGAEAPSMEELAAMQSFLPAIIGAMIGDPEVTPAAANDDLLAQARALLEQADLPEDLKDTLERVITFLDGSGGGGPEIPEGPVIQQFLYPTIGQGCIEGDQDSIGMALMTAGPQEAPAPGPGEGQAGYVFTALGTELPAESEDTLMVTWVNLDTGATGTEPLTDAAGINHDADGPGALSAIVDTGKGRIVSTIYGQTAFQTPDGPPVHCTVLPTVGLGVV